MFKRYLNEDENIVGISYGSLAANEAEINQNDFYNIAGLMINKPEKKGYEVTVGLIPSEFGENEYIYGYKYNKIPEDQWSDELLKDYFKNEILNSVTVADRPTGKEGYHLVPHFNGSAITWEFVQDEVIVKPDEAEGTYLDPITYVEGMSVEMGKWYTDGDNIWEAIQSGVPMNFNDRNFFDIIG